MGGGDGYSTEDTQKAQDSGAQERNEDLPMVK